MFVIKQWIVGIDLLLHWCVGNWIWHVVVDCSPHQLTSHGVRALSDGVLSSYFYWQDSRLINELLIERRIRIEAEDRNQQFSLLLQKYEECKHIYISAIEGIVVIICYFNPDEEWFDV